MGRFTILVIALVLAPGLQSAIIQTRPEISISTLPGVIATPELRPLPVPEVGVPELRPLPIPILPELRPEPLPESEAIHPELITVNPCDACFSYMTSLLEQLTEVAVPEQPQVPEVGLPAPDVPRPLPEGVLPEDLRPLPTPEEEEIEINPIPLPVAPEFRPLPLPIEPEFAPLPSLIPSEAEAEEALAVQDRPLPEYIIRK